MTFINEHCRRNLRAIGALVVDEDGAEVLLGCTVAESAFLFDYAVRAAAQRTPADTLVYSQLLELHLSARLARLRHTCGAWRLALPEAGPSRSCP
ncbi:hypothetical protein [Duganella levis]|uniref:Uncharacterized protein n=1 Tax=Duganella levis TaxID=2692169 RepID=A0ABW9VT53_9BURK|nr:hypothetical protein [Duganella levis]MYN24804.1 hypothetical protein [Duganella levis]